MRYVLYDGRQLQYQCGVFMHRWSLRQGSERPILYHKRQLRFRKLLHQRWDGKWEGVLRGQLYRRDLWKQGGLYF